MLSLTVSDSAPVAAGIYPARVAWVVDLGLQTSQFGTAPKVLVGFEFPTETRDDGRPAMLSRTYTASLTPKAALRELLAALLGPLTTGTKVTLRDLVGRPTMVTVAPKQKADGTMTTGITAVAAPGRYDIPPMVGPGLVYDRAAPDPAVLEQLPEWLKERIAAAVPAPTPTPRPAPPPPPPAAPAAKPGGKANVQATPAPAEVDPDDDLDGI